MHGAKPVAYSCTVACCQLRAPCCQWKLWCVESSNLDVARGGRAVSDAAQSVMITAAMLVSRLQLVSATHNRSTLTLPRTATPLVLRS